MPFSCEACAAQSYEANATRYDLAATARAIPPLASNRRFWFRRRKKRSYLEAASPMQVSCKPCAAQNYATNAPLRERAAIERASQIHARDRHVWPCCCEARSRRRAIANCPARLELRKITQPRLRVATALRPRAHCNRTPAIEKPRDLKFPAHILKRERNCKTHNK